MKAVWTRKAYRIYIKALAWERYNVGSNASQTMLKNLHDGIELVKKMPTAGQFERKVGRHEYRSYLIHPKCRMYYWYNRKEIHIVNFIFSMQK